MNEKPVLRPIPRNELSDEQRDLYDAILGKRQNVSSNLSLTDEDNALRGPFDPLLRTPQIGAAVSALGVALRHEASLPRRVNEAAILTTAVHWEGRFEWWAHEAIVRRADLLTDADIAAIREGNPPADPEIELAWRAARGVLSGARLPDDLSTEILGAWGEQGLVEVCLLVGHYSNLALLMHSLGIEPPR
ncbi:carboxymuconolactone decarboxylase family protein [Cumulibacter soli]|uniref:carboxymuconolactone decarboxylase family protein n=1 Tax=Cumulibacter soli TaxID=2546344 RepID=UPI0010680EF7|nr:carboxymuconolactone decarboxylase family protein [Cumulibacter soli]